MVRLNSREHEIIRYVSQKLALTKRKQELLILNKLILDENLISVIRNLTNQFGLTIAKEKFSNSVFLEDRDKDLYINAEFRKVLENKVFKNMLLEVLMRYKTEEDIDTCFLHRVVRKVRNDATISIDTIFFEVPQAYIGQRISLRYSPLSLSEIYIYDLNNQWVETVYPLNKIDNSKVKRATPYPTSKEATK